MVPCSSCHSILDQYIAISPYCHMHPCHHASLAIYVGLGFNMGPCHHASLAIYVGLGFNMGPCYYASLALYVSLGFNMGPCHHASLAIYVGLGFNMGTCHHASLAIYVGLGFNMGPCHHDSLTLSCKIFNCLLRSVTSFLYSSVDLVSCTASPTSSSNELLCPILLFCSAICWALLI